MVSESFLVFLVSGLWHGAQSTFIFWGALHGMCYVLSKATIHWRERINRLVRLNQYPKLHSAFKQLLVFHIVLLAWIFFRANSIADGKYMISHLLVNVQNVFHLGRGEDALGLNSLALDKFVIAFSILLIVAVEVVHGLQRKGAIRPWINQSSCYIRWTMYEALFLSTVLLGIFNHTKFIYFQF